MPARDIAHCALSLSHTHNRQRRPLPVSVDLCIYVCMDVCMYVYMYVCMHVVKLLCCQLSTRRSDGHRTHELLHGMPTCHGMPCQYQHNAYADRVWPAAVWITTHPI
ncbi:MAG TPA: hypothetical protein V6C97_06270 [Oculatellaceae cyanobacterium]